VIELATRLAPQGVYVEHRRVSYLRTWPVLNERHYVYLFPAAVVHDLNYMHDAAADDTPSTDSIRNRQALSA
jgi:hypothetical protein